MVSAPAAGFTSEIVRYLRQIEEADESGAVDLVFGMLDEGVSAQDVLLRVIGPAQRRVGRLWAVNRWSVAQEHAATAVSERVVAAVARRVSPPPTRGRVVVACVERENHALPTRLLAEVLRLHGWRADFLGASVPAPHLVEWIGQAGPELVALGCTLPVWLPRAHRAVGACRMAGVPVLVGGAAFGADDRIARLLGADAWAPAADIAADLLDTGPLPLAGENGAELPPDGEYACLARRRGELLPRALDLLVASYPPMRDYDPWQMEQITEDLGYVADFLGAALYLGDVSVFTDFVTWTCMVLAARGVPSESVVLGLAVLRGELTDCPRTRAFLAEGMRAAGVAPDAPDHPEPEETSP
ncbi:cobalamin B12-binding domain-containing protein [Microbispora triticiradicis]|uniref:Cobalamin B12-binding domain-containing protein n=3 Tax=Microbispora TaxID=2005 RepID=A0ABY3LT93_9ACTN|nr:MULTISPECIES: B12-binding domain-containing protein [Microbispora]RGA06851.1 cobalamin B12-binding domain-containing protein [Microbispora triticiradicis]TLP65991.1 cobalamin B12-binding domain-containing protein [Microbispora fusca]TYB53265.1 cobalamin B12-binding domain-containing protein [Microbispora tritici]GLW23418.1 cobalamin-binding protein [Microbispora amethystogenes]